MNIHRNFLLSAPINGVLRGVCFEGSSFDAESFYVWIFWIPLYVPTSVFYFNLGMRLCSESGGDRWNKLDDKLIENLTKSIVNQAVPFFQKVETQAGVVDSARVLAQESRDPYAHQALAFSLAKASDNDVAVGELDVLIQLLDHSVPWQNEIIERSKLLRDCVIAAPASVIALLESWTTANIQRLGIEALLQK